MSATLRILCTLSLVAAHAAPIAAHAQPGAAQEIDGRLAELVARQDQAGAGCAIGLRTAAGESIRAFGLANLELAAAIRPDTVFHVGSIAKQFTATAILMLAAEGKLSIEDSVRRFIPELPTYMDTVRLRHLLEHTSGIRDYSELLLIAGGLDTGPVAMDGVLDLLRRQQALNFAPGTRFSYSNSGYVLLALVVQRVSGMRFADFAATRIFGPLGMSDTRFLQSHAEIMPRRADGYRRAGPAQWQRADYLSDVTGDGGLFSSVRDLLHWTAHLEAGAASGDPLVRRLIETTRLPDGTNLPWGLGLEVRSTAQGRSLGHGGRDFGFQAYQVQYPDHHVAAVTLCNGREHDARQLAEAAAALALPPPAQQPVAAEIPTPEISPLPAAQLQRFVGLYFNPRTLAVRSIQAVDGHLLWARGQGTPLIPLGPAEFRFQNQPLTVRFSAPVGGAVQGMTVLNRASLQPAIYQRVAPPVGDLAAYLGRYKSNETGTEYQVSLAPEGRLAFRANPAFIFEAGPLFLDTFSVGEDIMVRFERRHGQVTGLTISTDRARNVRFDRQRGRR